MHSRHPVIAPLHRLMLFTQWVKVRRMIAGIATEPRQTFWNMSQNLLADAAAMEWSMVFGSRMQDTHWTKVVPREQHEMVRTELLIRLGLTQAEWTEYRATIVEYRNQTVAHHDLNADVAIYPHYGKALEAAAFMFQTLRSYAHDNELGGIPQDLDRWANTVAGNMSAIVTTAFRASAELGSNIPAKTG